MSSLLSSIRGIFAVLFPTRRLVIVTNSSTRSLKLYGVAQLLVLLLLVGGVSFFAVRYNKYKNYHNYAVLIEENERLRQEQKELKREFKEYDAKIDKLNEYLNLVQGADVVNAEKYGVVKQDKTKPKVANSEKKALNQDRIAIEKKKRDFVPIQGEEPNLNKAEMVEKLDEKMKVVYRKLDSRKVLLAQAVKRFGVSNITYSKLGKKVKIYRSPDDSAKEFVASIIDDKYVGGNDGVVDEVEVFQSKPLIDVSETRVDGNNFYRELKKMKVVENVLMSLPLGKPTKAGYRTTSTYGLRQSPFYRDNRVVLHSGVDMVLQDDAVLSSGDGVVVFVGAKYGYGNCIDIEHMRKGGIGSIVTHYAHLDKLLVKKGQIVKAGEKIGIQGNTGHSTGKHLHYEVRLNGKTVNPYKFMNEKVFF